MGAPRRAPNACPPAATSICCSGASPCCKTCKSSPLTRQRALKGRSSLSALPTAGCASHTWCCAARWAHAPAAGAAAAAAAAGAPAADVGWCMDLHETKQWADKLMNTQGVPLCCSSRFLPPPLPSVPGAAQQALHSFLHCPRAAGKRHAVLQCCCFLALQQCTCRCYAAPSLPSPPPPPLLAWAAAVRRSVHAVVLLAPFRAVGHNHFADHGITVRHDSPLSRRGPEGHCTVCLCSHGERSRAPPGQ